jgi:hypothetical protein
VVTAAHLYILPQHKPTLEAERILAVDLTSNRAQANGGAPTIRHEGDQCSAFAKASQNMATAAMLLDTLPPPSTDEVDRLYH